MIPLQVFNTHIIRVFGEATALFTLLSDVNFRLKKLVLRDYQFVYFPCNTIERL